MHEIFQKEMKINKTRVWNAYLHTMYKYTTDCKNESNIYFQALTSALDSDWEINI